MVRMGRAFVLALFLSALLPVSAEAGWGACGSARTFVHTFTVDTKWAGKVFGPGDVAKVVITVTRPAPEDPLGLGVPLDVPVGFPAEGVDVSTSFQGFFPFVFDAGVTDADGKVSMKLKLPRDAERGPVDAYTYASILHNRNGPGCSDFEEYGFKWDIPAVMVR
jgi:hypothetical protein